MKRLRRRLFNFAAGISLLLLSVSLALWMRSYRGRSIERVDPDRKIVVASVGGLISMARWDGRFEAPAGPDYGSSRAPRRVCQQWGYWRGWDGHERDPEAWAYLPFGAGDRWWQALDFDGFDMQIIPVRGTIPMHDWQTNWSGRKRGLTLPYWAIAFPLAALPMIGFLKRAQRRWWTKAGLCPTCGYDLRATPDRCPECGNEASAAECVRERKSL